MVDTISMTRKPNETGMVADSERGGNFAAPSALRTWAAPVDSAASARVVQSRGDSVDGGAERVVQRFGVGAARLRSSRFT